MNQIFGNFIRYDADAKFLNREDIKFNSIDVADLEGCLIIFRVKNEEAYDFLKNMWTDEAIADVGCSVLILKDDDIAGIDVIDTIESEKITLRSLDPKIEEKLKKAENRKKNDRDLDKMIEDIVD